MTGKLKSSHENQNSDKWMIVCFGYIFSEKAAGKTSDHRKDSAV